MKLNREFLFSLSVAIVSFHLLDFSSSKAATVTPTVNVTIGAGGGVGPTPVIPETTTTVETTGDANGDGEITTTVGDAIAVQTSNFRAIAPAPQAAVTATTQAASAASQAATADPSSPAAAAAERFNEGARAASDYFGGASSVAVSGVPNQTYNITLPGETSYSTGAEIVDIGGFAHDAGATPQLSEAGSGTFNVAADVNDAGQFQTAGSEAGGEGDTVGDVGSVEQILATPVVTRSPFVSIIVSYN